MKEKMKFALAAFALLFCLASCGKKGSNNNSNNNLSAQEQYDRCANDPACNEQYMTGRYGPNQQGYYQGNQNCGGGYQCQVYNAPQYQGGCNQGCGQQQYVVAPQGAYIPSQGIYGQGGSFYLNYSYRR